MNIFHVFELLKHNDIKENLKMVEDLNKNNPDIKIECRLTNFEPTISTMLTKDFAYIDILTLGRKESKKQSVTLPIIEFSSDSDYYEVAKRHFLFHWKYSVSVDQYFTYEPVYKTRFFDSSLTGYKLINQHESWISIDPIVGCKGGCRYCVLRTSFKNNTKPTLLTSIDKIVERLKKNKFYHPESILSIFNFTDGFLKENHTHLLHLLRKLQENNIENTLCISVKHGVPDSFLYNIIENYNKDKIIIFISLSGLSNDFEPNIDHEYLIDTMKRISNLGISIFIIGAQL